MANPSPSRNRPRLLAIEKRTWDHYEGLGVTALLVGVGAFTVGAAALSRTVPFDARLILLAFGLAFLIPAAAITYAKVGMRGAVWEDGFRPTASDRGFRAATYLRRLLRAKVRWSEIQRLTLRREARAGTPTSLSILISLRDELTLRIASPESESHALVSLIAFERWRLLGGPVSERGTEGKLLELPAAWAGPTRDSTPAAAPPSLEADRAGWARYEQVAGAARNALAKAMVGASGGVQKRIEEALAGKETVRDRLDALYGVSSEAKRERAEAVAPATAAWADAVQAATAAYRSVVGGHENAWSGGRLSWLPRADAVKDTGAALREADRWFQNDLHDLVLFAGLTAVCLPLAAWTLASGSLALGLLLLLLGAAGGWTTLWISRLKADEFHYFVLIPRSGAAGERRRAIAPEQSAYFNPFAYRAVPVFFHDEFVRVDFPAHAKGGEPMGVVGLVAFSYERTEEALLRAADMLLAEPAPDVSRWLEGVVKDVAGAMVAKARAEKWGEGGGRLEDEELWRAVDAVVTARGLRMQHTGAVIVGPHKLMEAARREAGRKGNEEPREERRAS